MAISSVGGQDATSTPGAISSTPGQTTEFPGVVSASSDLTPQADPSAADPAKPQATPLGEGQTEAPKEGAAQEDDPSKAKEETPKEGELTDDQIRAQLKEAGGFYADPKYEAAAIEFTRTGDISDATVKSTAEAFGVPEDMVRQFVDGQKALRANASQVSPEVAQLQTEVHSIVGGADQYTAFMTWGKDNIPEAVRVAYDNALDNNPIAAKAMLKEFVSDWKAAGNGPAPKDVTDGAPTVTPDSAKAGDTKPYASSAEMQTDMADPRYAQDEAFRRQVAARLAVSQF